MLANCEKIHFCCLSRPASDIFLYFTGKFIQALKLKTLQGCWTCRARPDGSRNHRHSCFTAVCSQIRFRLLELLAFLLHSHDYGVFADLFSFLYSKLCSIFIIAGVFSGAVIYCLVTRIYSEQVSLSNLDIVQSSKRTLSQTRRATASLSNVI